MILKNRTDWDDSFLRRLVAWVAKEIELPAKEIRQAAFSRTKTCAFRGRAWWSGRIRVVIGPEQRYPVKPFLYPGRQSERYLSPHYADPLEALVGVTAHELTHLRDFMQRHRNGRTGRGPGETNTRAEERRVHALFVARKTELIALWSAAAVRSAANRS